MKKLSSVPMVLGDMVRFLVETVVYAIPLFASLAAFTELWRFGKLWLQVVAFPAAVAAFGIAFCLMVLLLPLVFVRKVYPGSYHLKRKDSLRWIIGQSVIMLVNRSFLRGWIQDFALQRYLFYRLMGARIDMSLFMGEGAKVLDPWTLEVGHNVTLGAFSLICGHTIVGDSLTVKRVKIGDSATIGMRSVILPGVEIGKDAIIGAGAVVTKDTVIPAGEIWAGVPARKIGEVGELNR